MTGYDWTDRGKDWIGNYEIGLGWTGWIGLDRIEHERIGLNRKEKDRIGQEIIGQESFGPGKDWTGKDWTRKDWIWFGRNRLNRKKWNRIG